MRLGPKLSVHFNHWGLTEATRPCRQRYLSLRGSQGGVLAGVIRDCEEKSEVQIVLKVVFLLRPWVLSSAERDLPNENWLPLPFLLHHLRPSIVILYWLAKQLSIIQVVIYPRPLILLQCSATLCPLDCLSEDRNGERRDALSQSILPC